MGYKTNPVLIWAYLVVVTMVEVLMVSLNVPFSTIAVIILAFSEAALIVMFGLQIWFEKPFIILAVASVFFAALAIVLSLGSIGH